jgi:hypothetical protein
MPPLVLPFPQAYSPFHHSAHRETLPPELAGMTGDSTPAQLAVELEAEVCAARMTVVAGTLVAHRSFEAYVYLTVAERGLAVLKEEQTSCSAVM